MNIKESIKTALTGIDAALQQSATEFPRVWFFEYLEQPEWFGDGCEDARGHYVQVDIFSMDDVTALIDDVMERMDNAGFEYLSSEDLYEDDTQVYHRAIRYFYLEERR